MSLFFLHKQSRRVEEVEKATPDVAKIKQLETKLKLKFWLLLLLLLLIVLLLILFLKEHHSSSSSSFLSSVSSRFIYFVIFSKNMTCSTPLNCLLSKLLLGTCFQIRKTAYRSGLYTSSKYYIRTFGARGTKISIFLPFCSKRSKQAVCA